jgi:ubiquinone/menaquinone biosynthesis C-methylase UbiE
MAANYDHTAWFYERLSKLVFGEAQVKAQEFFLDRIPPKSNILIIGGGTGQILESLTRLHPSDLQITYVEISAKMMTLSRKRNIGQNHVNFITAGIEEAAFTHVFDSVITAFLFDNFPQDTLNKVFPIISAQLKSGGLWLNTDFQLTGPLWQKLMLRSMYTFFRLFSAVAVSKLPNVKMLFGKHSYQLSAEESFYGNFISAKLYRKV